LAAENAGLRELSNFSAAPAAGQITARVIADSSNAFVRSLLVLAGEPDGVVKGQAAVTGQGLVGRVTAVGERASRVLLVTDINSRIPVRIDRTRERAVLAGNNSSSPALIYLPPETGVQVGDRIVTSGHGGVFPKGIPVGVVTVVDGETVLVRPHFDWSRIEYLRLIDYKLPGILGGRPERGPEAGP
jgi:rod shape-determining protein MreC